MKECHICGNTNTKELQQIDIEDMNYNTEKIYICKEDEGCSE